MTLTSKLAISFCRVVPASCMHFSSPSYRQIHASERKLSIQKTAKLDYNDAIADAERLVGHSKSFLNLKWLLNDDIAKALSNFAKLPESSHPVLQTFKDLLYNKNGKSRPPWGLIVLLVSQAAAARLNHGEWDESKTGGVLQSQRSLAELTEMMWTSHLILKTFLHLNSDINLNAALYKELDFGNKIGLLIGDTITASCISLISTLRNQDLTLLMAHVIRDMKEEEFLVPRDTLNNPLPAKPGPEGSALKDWSARNFLLVGSILASSCQGALLLGKQDDDLQKQGYEFGKHLALAWQARRDLEPFLADSQYVPGSPFSLVSAPVLLQLERQPSIFPLVDVSRRTVLDVDYLQLYEYIMAGSCIEETNTLLQLHSKAAWNILKSNFSDCEALSALSNIITAMGDVTSQSVTSQTLPTKSRIKMN